MARFLATIIRLWALLGGFLLCALAVMTAASALSNLLFEAPLPADHELIKHGVAIIIFMFLPYCQLAGANVSVDIFTNGMGARTKAVMATFASLLAVAFSALLLRQMAEGLESYLAFVEVTPVLQLPIWTAFPPILVSLALLLVASAMTLMDALRQVRRGQAAAADAP
ncbi:MAG: TRAP transporter small permease subunit [Pseudomonadota bacterium]